MPIMPAANHELGGTAMRAQVASVATGAALAAIFAAAVAAAPATKLAPADIQSTFFNGQPFTAATPSNVKYKMTFMPDGRMRREPTSGGTRGEGTWKLSNDGFCTTWAGAKSNCFTVAPAGDNKWSVLHGSNIVATWSK